MVRITFSNVGQDVYEANRFALMKICELRLSDCSRLIGLFAVLTFLNFSSFVQISHTDTNLVTQNCIGKEFRPSNLTISKAALFGVVSYGAISGNRAFCRCIFFPK